MLTQALKELELTKKELPKVTLHYRSLAKAEKVMLTVQSQWKNVLGLARISHKPLGNLETSVSPSISSGSFGADFLQRRFAYF